MKLLAKDELKQLIEKQEQPCVSIFMPTHRTGREIQQDPIRLKNLLTKAEERLVAKEVRAPEARRWLEPAQSLFNNDDFWQKQRDGLALFIAEEFFETYRLPLNFEELLVVSNRFHVKPLLPLFSNDGYFYILALSQNEVRLFQGTQYTIDELELEGVPESLAEALKYDLPQKQQQFHTKASAGAAGSRPAIFHGHGVGDDSSEKEAILRYCQQVNKGVRNELKNEQTPLVLACVDYLLPIYKTASTYPHLLDKGVQGNPESLKPKELQKRAWEIVKPHFQQVQEEAISRYRNLSNTEQVSKDMRTIIPAAHYGQVDTLFVAVGEQQWGTFDSKTNTIDLHQNPEAGDEDLLDAAAAHTLLNGGTVHALASEKIPEKVPLAAILRYS